MSDMKVFGITIVRNEADIIGVTVAHHLSLGLDRIIVLDNGSTDNTPEILRDLALSEERLKWVSDDSPFDQASLATKLARDAYRQGADWVLPFDADEFWCAKHGDFRRILSESEGGCLHINVVNFIQTRHQHESRATGLLSITGRATETVSPGQHSRQLVESHQLSSLQVDYRPKCISRPTADIEVGRGNHWIKGVKGECVWCEDIVCLHAPLRSRSLLESKVERIRRLNEAEMTRGAPRVWRWARIVEEGRLDQEWAANSYENGYLNVYGKKQEVVFDPRLRDLTAPHIVHTSEETSIIRRTFSGTVGGLQYLRSYIRSWVARAISSRETKR